MKFGPLVCLPGSLAVSGVDGIESWERHGRNLFQMQKHVPWWLGDFINLGVSRFGEDFWQCVPEDADIKMLENFARMAKLFPAEERFNDLSWRHHSIALRIKNKDMRLAMMNIAAKDKLDPTEFAKKVEAYG